MILETLTAALLIFTIIGYSRQFWWFSVADFFRLHYVVISLALLLFAFMDLRFLVVLANMLIIGLNLYKIMRFPPNLKDLHIEGKKDVLSINAYKHNHDPSKLLNLLGKADADLLLIMEMTDELEKQLRPQLNQYKDHLETYVRDGFRIALYSKTTLEDKNVSHYGKNETPLLEAKTVFGDTKFQVYSAHPKPALNKKWFEERQAYFEDLTKIINETELPVLAMGDFNSVPWEKHFTKFLENTDMKSTLEGHGYKITWPAVMPLFGVPMDHILMKRGTQYYNFNIGPYAGSDHYPIAIDLVE